MTSFPINLHLSSQYPLLLWYFLRASKQLRPHKQVSALISPASTPRTYMCHHFVGSSQPLEGGRAAHNWLMNPHYLS